MTMPSPIGPDDVVSVEGRYFVKSKDGTRVLIKGIAFPAPLIESDDDTGYDEKGWIAVLDQLHDLKLEINTIRIYRMDPKENYSKFMNRAASLGIYVLVPLTGVSDGGVLDRDKAAPKCYPRKLFDYGKACLDNFGRYPNVIGGLIANEVMNSLETWKSAPCVAAYARDLKLYSKAIGRDFPLVYAAQHDSIGAAVLPSQVMKATMDYLTCDDEEGSIDVFGINVESWCSSLQTFEQNEDGSIGAYYDLWQTLHNSSVALMFTEMGCSKVLFNRDNGLTRYERDWAQVPVVLDDMRDSWSGFSAYAYDGNLVFSMMKDGPWNGHEPLLPTKDFENFRDQLHIYNEQSGSLQPNKTLHVSPRPSCESVEAFLQERCDVILYKRERMPSYFRREQMWTHTGNKSFASAAANKISISHQLIICNSCLRRRAVALFCSRRFGRSGTRFDEEDLPRERFAVERFSIYSSCC